VFQTPGLIYICSSNLGSATSFNFSKEAVIDDGSCRGKELSSANIVSLKTFPQPVKNRMFVSIETNALNQISNLISVKNILGETVFSTKIDGVLNNFELNLEDLSRGVYYLLLEVDNQVVLERFIID